MTLADRENLAERVRKLGQEKSNLQLVFTMMNRVVSAPGLETVVENLLQCVVDCIGGTSLLLYYRIDDEMYSIDLQGQNKRVDHIGDEEVRRVFENGEPRQREEDFSVTRMTTREFSRSYTWIYPLAAGSEIVGVFRMEGLPLAMRHLHDSLPMFFSYAALILKNEIRSRSRLQQALDAVTCEVAHRRRTEQELHLAQETLEERVRKRTEELHRSEEKYRRIVETANEGICALDRKHRVVFVNERMAEMLGFRPEEMIGVPVEQFIFPEDIAGHLARMEQRRLGRKGDYEHRFLRKDGGETWCHVSATALMDEQGLFAGSFAMFTDITERRNAEESMRAGARELRAVLEAVTESVFLMTPDGTVLLANRTMAERLGRQPDDIEGCTAYDLLPREVSESRREQVEMVMRTGRRQTFVDERFGRWLENSVYPVFNEQGDIVRLAVFGRDVTETKKADESLAKSEALLNNTQRLAGIGGWEWDVAAQTMSWTDEVYRIHGLLRSDAPECDARLISRSIACYALDARPLIEASFRACVEYGEPYDLELPFTTVQGVPLWVRTSAHAEREGEKIARVVGTLMDITGRKNAELALKESHERFRIIFSQSSVGVATVAPDFTFLQANAAFCTFVGYSEDELRHMNFVQVTHPGSRQADIEQVSRLLSGEIAIYTTDKQYIRKDGRCVWGRLSVSVVRNSENAPLYFLPIVQDITERKQAEQALQESENRLKSIFLAAPVGIGITSNRIITDVNDTLCRMTGYAREDLVGKSSRILYPDDAEFEMVGREKYGQIREKGTGTVETRWVRKDGSEITIILSSTPLHQADISRGVTFTALDISELRNSLLEKEVLLREVHHRVKNNLAAIIGLLEMQRKGIDQPSAAASLQDLACRIKSMALVHERLYRSDNIARIDLQGYIEPLASHLRTVFRAPAAVRCTVEAAGVEMGLDLAIPCALIINELVTNAIKHAFPAGKPRPGFDDCEILISAHRAGDDFFLKVADNGIGFAPDSDWRSFPSLGLRLVRMLGEHQLGGHIRLDSSQGTCFELKFTPRRGRHSHDC